MDLKITPSGQTIVKPTALGPVANTDTKLLIYGLFQKGRVLAQDGDLMDRFVKWWRDGDYSWSGDCFDIGNTTCQALTRLCSAKSRSRVDCAV